ncbi:MAG TPA: phosphate ABC transporter substrate-binding protein PstS [Candidatus Dormibacteraeota bacterium]|nr:phosphate ABC transporter substrate-binding protein PstS [Candidatus Dormibacteraeota bacterium]
MVRSNTAKVTAVALFVFALVSAACGGSNSSGANADVGKGSLTGAGATFPEPFYSKAFYMYNQLYPQVSVNYQAVGSGAGIQQFIQGTVDFGASDVPMQPSDISAAGGTDTLVQIPTTLGVVAIAYNLPGVSRLQLDGQTLAAIYLGRIKRWNDAALTSLNPGVNLPSTSITVVHRSDGSGTTYHFTDYLGKISTDWKTQVGVAKSVQWPVGVGGKGNDGVAQAIKQAEGAIGYVELAYVVQTGMQQAYIANKSGKFVQATVAGATAAAAQNQDVSATNFSITNEPGDTTYPIAGFSWVIVRTSITDAGRAKAVAYLLKWLVTDGQQYGSDLQYAPLPKTVQNLALTELKQVSSGGKPVLS